MNDLEILSCLKKNSKNDIVFEFTKAIFNKELRGEYEWRNDYSRIIDEYVEKGD